MKKSIALLLAGCAFAAVSLPAQVILSPTSVLANTMGTFSPGFYLPEQTINHSGLLTNFTSGVTNFNTYLAANPQHSFDLNTEFFAAQGVFTGSIDYDLGGLFKIDRMALWNEDGWGLASVQIFGSTAANFASSVDFGIFAVNDNAFGIDYGAQVLNFAQSADVRYIRLAVLSSQPDASAASIGEVAFSASPASLQGVPEPSTYGMMGAAALLGAAIWRKRRAA